MKKYLFLFFAASVLGYIWEVLLFLLKEDRFYNRGFFYGPWLPVYGLGAVLLDLGLHWLSSHPVYVFFLSLFIGTGVELAIGLILDLFWNRRYWDYSGYILNLDGYICLSSALAFGFAGMLWICFVTPRLLKALDALLPKHQNLLLTIIALVFLFDLAVSLIFPNAGQGVTF
ncbi:MAG: putative ABC transporter permease [Clostridiales bacterium]|nr:putative ABC transporter permease [Clostridiales bacterium]